MINERKLRGRITEMGFTITSLSTAMQMTRPPLRAKLVGKTDFKVSEIGKLRELLRIPKQEIELYFFTDNVSKADTIL